MSPSRLEAAWASVIANIRGPEAIPALVAVLDRYRALDELKARVLREAAQEMRADRDPADTHSRPGRWLRDQLEGGERRVQELKDAAMRDGIGWRSVERVKREAGAVATRHDRASWWSLTPPTPPPHAEPSGTLSR